MHFTKKKITAVVASTAVVALGAGAAYAYWTSTGTGDGAGSTGTSTGFTVTEGVNPGPALTPGGPSQTIPFTVTNPSTGSQLLSSVVITVASPGGTWTAVPGCSAADYALGTPAIVYGQIAGLASVTGSVTVTMNNLSANQDACKNAAYPLHFVAS